jgi:NADP-dependent 3-hydroxy acid dehydrogenase YdfG
MASSIVILGAGPGLGRSVAARFTREGYAAVLVGRRAENLARIAADLPGRAVTLTADLGDTGALPDLISRIRDEVGDPDVLYFASQPGGTNAGFTPAADLTPDAFPSYLALALYTPVAMVHAFLPAMLERGAGAVLVAQGMAAVRGLPGMSGPGPVLAAQRNYLQSLEAEVGPRGVFVGRLYIGAAIEGTPFHSSRAEARAAGRPVAPFPDVDPALLADMLWTMREEGVHERLYPAGA